MLTGLEAIPTTLNSGGQTARPENGAMFCGTLIYRCDFCLHGAVILLQIFWMLPLIRQHGTRIPACLVRFYRILNLKIIL